MIRDGQVKSRSELHVSLVAGKRRHRPRYHSGIRSRKWLFVLSVLAFLSVLSVNSLNAHTIPSSVVHPSVTPSPTSPSPLIASSPLVLANPGSVSVGSVGSTFAIQFQVQNMPQFNGWDIRVWTASEIINATSLSISGNDFAVNASSGTPLELVHCVNGHGTGCTSSDTSGWVHSSYVNQGIVSGSGLLFTITYQIVGNAASSILWFGYSPISIQNDVIASSGNNVYHTTISGTYGTQMFSGGIGGDSVPRHD